MFVCVHKSSDSKGTLRVASLMTIHVEHHQLDRTVNSGHEIKTQLEPHCQPNATSVS